jgi:dTDP-glucose pyrophosphorylase
MSPLQMKKNLKAISISSNASLKEAIDQMDLLNGKLLIVVNEHGNFVSIISIGDIQRYLIKHQNINAKVYQALRPNVRFASIHDKTEKVKEIMMEFRTEFMPVLNDSGQLEKVIFWEDLFENKQVAKKRNFSAPVVIMAGGKGERLKPITNIIPKPLVPLGERPIVQIIMDQFSKYGSKSFFLTVNYKAEMIQDYINQIERDYEVTYIKEDFPLGTAGSLSLLKGKLHETFFISNCDILIDQDYGEVLKWHKENRNEITSIAAIKNYNIPYGTLTMKEDGLLEDIQEKPDLTFYVNAGVYLMEPHLLNEIPENKLFHITTLMEQVKSRKGRVGVYPVSEGSWMDIGNWIEYNKTQKIFENRFL